MNQKMIEEILEYLPHRYPMLLVDRITDVVTDESIRGFKNITYNEQVFQGHFPQRPILPGVMILEALAQISGILALQGRDLAKDNPGIYLFAGIDKYCGSNLPIIFHEGQREDQFSAGLYQQVAAKRLAVAVSKVNWVTITIQGGGCCEGLT